MHIHLSPNRGEPFIGITAVFFLAEDRLMPELVSKCGMDCGSCPWGPYPRKDMTVKEFEQYKRRTKTILGYTPLKTPCFMCQTRDAEIPKGSKLPSRNCLVRQCVDKTGVRNCAYCSRFPCEGMRSISGAWNREFFEEKHGAKIPEEDYLTFIKPFEAIKRLKEMRASLHPDDIIEAHVVPQLETKVVNFPKNLPLSTKETTVFKSLHQVLAVLKRSSLGFQDTDTFVQQQRLKRRIPHFFRFLWILGCYGNLKTENGAYLAVDAKTYIDNRGKEKALAQWSFVKDVIFKTLIEFGVHCERVASEGAKEENLATPSGYLRSKGWHMMMRFNEKTGGATTLKALQAYTHKLHEKYGKKAFQYFIDVDMQVLGDR